MAPYSNKISQKFPTTSAGKEVWVYNNIQPILNEWGGEIFGGFVRDWYHGQAFKDIDINCHAPFSQVALDGFLKLLTEKLKGTGCEAKIKANGYLGGTEHEELKISNYLSSYNRGTLVHSVPVLRTKIFIMRPGSSRACGCDSCLALEIDLVWDKRGSLDLDLDIHACYLDRTWQVQVFPQVKYRFARTNLINKQYLPLNSNARRLEKIKYKNFKYVNKIDGVNNRELIFPDDPAQIQPNDTSGPVNPLFQELCFPVLCPQNSLVGAYIPGYISAPLAEGPGKGIRGLSGAPNRLTNTGWSEISMQITGFIDLPSKAAWATNGKWLHAVCQVPRVCGPAANPAGLVGWLDLDKKAYHHYYVMVQPDSWTY